MKRICIPITGPTVIDAARQVEAAISQGDLLEFRLDLFQEYTLEELSTLRKKSPLPVIFKEGSAEKMLKLAALHPDYLDIDVALAPYCAQALARAFPHIQQILSYHNFEETPSDLEGLLRRLSQTPAALYKIACYAHSTNDALRMLCLVQKHAPLLGICMGEKGVLTRVLGAPWTYAYLEHKTAEGQLSVAEMAFLLTPTTALYGLIGGAVTQSVSHLTHNRVMQELALDALYVKMVVAPEELEAFLSLAQQVGFCGLSVTMPLKEVILPFLDVIDKEAQAIGAVNTIVFLQGKRVGYNTDGKGALDALESKGKVRGKRLRILGAGGAARAIIYEAHKRGALIHIMNRTSDRAHMLARKFGVEVGEADYDYLVNTVPDASSMPLNPHAIVMDVQTLPKMTPFLRAATSPVFGYEMFINQAVAQFQLWFPSLDSACVRDILYEEMSNM